MTWTSAETREFISMYRDGWSLDQISNALGQSVEACCERQLQLELHRMEEYAQMVNEDMYGSVPKLEVPAQEVLYQYIFSEERTVELNVVCDLVDISRMRRQLGTCGSIDISLSHFDDEDCVMTRTQ